MIGEEIRMGAKGFRIVSVVILILGVFSLLVCLAAAWGGGRLMAQGRLNMSQTDWIGSLVLSFVGAGLALAAGIRETAWYPWLMPLWVCLVSLGLAEILNALKYRAKRGE